MIRSTRYRRAHGAALLLVLWLIALLAALVGTFALTSRTEQLQGRALHRGAVAAEAARAGLEYAVARVLDPVAETRWQADGRDYAWRFQDAGLVLRIVDEAGKVDLNAASPELLAGLLRALGEDGTRAGELAAAIVDWRDIDDLGQPQGAAEDPQYAAAGLPYAAKDAPFEDLAELQQVLGMPPATYAALLPHVTVYSAMPTPDPQYATAPVLQALGIDPEPVLAQRQPQPGMPAPVAMPGAGSGTYSIDSHARLADGRVATLRAVVRTGGGAPGSAYTPLFWKEGVSVSEPQPRP